MSIDYYAGLLKNISRLEAFRRGIRAAVRPGDRVLDVGTGLGTYAFMAVEAGASRVWAVDRHPVIHLAESMAKTNGMADRVTFVRGEASELDVPEPFDVVIFEDFTATLVSPELWRELGELVRLHLAPGGRFVPPAAHLHLALVDAEAVRGALHLDLDADALSRLGIHHGLMTSRVAAHPRQMDLKPGTLRSRPVTGPPLSLAPPPSAAAFALEGEWTADTSGAVGGLALWFSLETAPGVRIDNRPSDPGEAWGQVVLPVHPPVPVAEGETVWARASRDTLGDGAPGWLEWEIRCGGRHHREHEFRGELLGLDDLLEPGRADPHPG